MAKLPREFPLPELPTPNVAAEAAKARKDAAAPPKAATSRATPVVMTHWADRGLATCGKLHIKMFAAVPLDVTCEICWASLGERGLVPTKLRRYENRIAQLTPAIAEGITAAVRNGTRIEAAAALVGIGLRTVTGWLEAGNRIAESELRYLTEEERALLDFTDRMREAIAACERDLIDNIRRAGQMAKHWHANAWLLEKKHPHVYGKKSEVAITTTQQASTVDLSKLTDDQLRELDNMLAQAGDARVIDVTPAKQLDASVALPAPEVDTDYSNEPDDDESDEDA